MVLRPEFHPTLPSLPQRRLVNLVESNVAMHGHEILEFTHSRSTGWHRALLICLCQLYCLGSSVNAGMQVDAGPCLGNYPTITASFQPYCPTSNTDLAQDVGNQPRCNMDEHMPAPAYVASVRDMECSTSVPFISQVPSTVLAVREGHKKGLSKNFQGGKALKKGRIRQALVGVSHTVHPSKGCVKRNYILQCSSEPAKFAKLLSSVDLWRQVRIMKFSD